MKQSFSRLALSLVLLLAAAAVLLLSDLHSRVGARKETADTKITVAILKHNSNPLLDDTESGMTNALAEQGFHDGEKIILRRFCAEGDLATGNTIAKNLSDGSYRLVLTASTLMLQAMANANKDGRAVHVFAAVTDPAGAGVGIQQMGTTNKPAHLAGIGSFQPVESIFRMAKQLWPGLQVVGVVWNPAERNSEACTIKAREICRVLGMQLVEATVDQSKDVREAAESLVARGAQAFWTGADVTVLNATSALCDVAIKAHVPVFSNNAGHVKNGTLFDLGANYYEVGHMAGEIASAILKGADPAQMLITNFMPERIMLNQQVLKKMKDPWRFTPEVIAQADLILGEDGQVIKSREPQPASTSATGAVKVKTPEPGRVYKIALAYFGPEEGVDSAINGLMAGLRPQGFSEPANLSVRKLHANGEISAIPAMLQSLDASEVDVIVALSTPVITAACATVKRKPVVFTYCTDPLAAGVGKSFEDHLPFITGVGSFPPLEDLLYFLKLTFPRANRIAAFYNNAEANSVKVVEVLRSMCATNGLTLIEATANNTSEVVPAVQSLVARQAEVMIIPGDNTAYQAFAGIANVSAQAKIPLLIDAPEFVDRGALACVGIGYYHSGFAGAEPLARVLLGESPERIPLKNVAVKKIVLNRRLAAQWGITFPPEVLKMEQAEAQPQTTRTPAPPPTKKWRIQQIAYLESPMIEDAVRGVAAGLREADLEEGRHFTRQSRCAQGDMAALGSLFDSAEIAGVDMYLLFSTPTLQTAIKKIKKQPVVFTVVADPFTVGAGKTDHEHLPNVTGIYTLGPYPEMAELLATHFPALRRVGTLFCPAEVNSVVNKDLFVKEANRRGLEVETMPANSAAELADAALALCGRKIDAIVQVVDNISAAGFPTIARSASVSRLPVFACQDVAAKQGAALVLSRDYFEAGREAAEKMALIMRGQNPAQIPFSPPRKVKMIINLQNAKAVRLSIPAAVLEKADQKIDASNPAR